jgi:hypothetical protein
MSKYDIAVRAGKYRFDESTTLTPVYFGDVGVLGCRVEDRAGYLAIKITEPNHERIDSAGYRN